MKRTKIIGSTSHISVLVIARADDAALTRTLDSLRGQEVLHFDVTVATLAEAGYEARVAAFAESACGDWVAVLEAGDVLAPYAFSEIALALRYAPESDIVYSDEDFLDSSGMRCDPYLKPSWSPDLLYAFNYFGRLTILRRTLVAAVGGFDLSMGGGMEWKLNLFSSARASTITRIPKVLCHRRPGSDRGRPARGTDAAKQQASALTAFWTAQGIDAEIHTQPDGTQRTIWPSERLPLISVVIPTKDKIDLLRMCVEGLLHRTDYAKKQIIIVDTGSIEQATLDYYEALRAHAEVRIVHFDKKFNYSAACNYGASFSRAELLLFLNNDIEVVSRDWLKEMAGFAMRPGVGVVGAKLVYPSGELQHGGVAIGIHLCGLVYRSSEGEGWGVFGSPDHPRNWLAIMGACQLVRRDAFDRIGGFDESYLVAMSDVALCLRAWRAGYRVAYAPHACLIHHEGATRGKSNPTLDVRRIADDIRLLGIDEDPYLHPGLDGNAPIPTLRAPGAPGSRETLKADIRAFGSPVPLTPLLDLNDDGACLKNAELPREQVLWLPSTGPRGVGRMDGGSLGARPAAHAS